MLPPAPSEPPPQVPVASPVEAEKMPAMVKTSAQLPLEGSATTVANPGEAEKMPAMVPTSTQLPLEGSDASSPEDTCVDSPHMGLDNPVVTLECEGPEKKGRRSRRSRNDERKISSRPKNADVVRLDESMEFKEASFARACATQGQDATPPTSGSSCATRSWLNPAGLAAQVVGLGGAAVEAARAAGAWWRLGLSVAASSGRKKPGKHRQASHRGRQARSHNGAKSPVSGGLSVQGPALPCSGWLMSALALMTGAILLGKLSAGTPEVVFPQFGPPGAPPSWGPRQQQVSVPHLGTLNIDLTG